MTAPGTNQHELIKHEKYANVSIGLLQRELSLAGLFWRWSEMDFKGAKDDTINVKVPGTLWLVTVTCARLARIARSRWTS